MGTGYCLCNFRFSDNVTFFNLLSKAICVDISFGFTTMKWKPLQWVPSPTSLIILLEKSPNLEVISKKFIIDGNYYAYDYK